MYVDASTLCFMKGEIMEGKIADKNEDKKEKIIANTGYWEVTPSAIIQYKKTLKSETPDKVFSKKMIVETLMKW
jgi:hypothetical protein